MIVRQRNRVGNNNFIYIRVDHTAQGVSGKKTMGGTNDAVPGPPLLQAFHHIHNRRSRINQVLDNDRRSSFNIADNMRDY
ncbi:hypothetical protein D3C87_2021180 [compost metagenome]